MLNILYFYIIIIIISSSSSSISIIIILVNTSTQGIYNYMCVCWFQNVVLRCPTPRLHCFLSSHWPSFRFLSFMASLISSIQFSFGLPRALFCFGIHFNAILGNLPSAILWTWPSHVSWFCSISFIIGSSNYNYIPETNHFSTVYSVAAVLYLQTVLHVILFLPRDMSYTFTLALPAVCVCSAQ